MIGEDLEVLETGVGKTVVRPVGVPPAGTETTGVVVVLGGLTTAVELELLVVVLLTVVELVRVEVATVVAAVPWMH